MKLQQAMKSIDDIGEDLSSGGWVQFLLDIIKQCETRIEAERNQAKADYFADPDGDGNPQLD